MQFKDVVAGMKVRSVASHSGLTKDKIYEVVDTDGAYWVRVATDAGGVDGYAASLFMPVLPAQPKPVEVRFTNLGLSLTVDLSKPLGLEVLNAAVAAYAKATG